MKGKLSENAIRAHALLTKILRCVAEETAPSEEALRPLAQWMERAITSVRRFFKLALVRLLLELVTCSVPLTRARRMWSLAIR